MTRQQEFEGKIARIRAFLKERGLGGVALSSQALFAWATAGGDNHVALAHDHGAAHLLVTADRKAVHTTLIEVFRLCEEELKIKGLCRNEIVSWAWEWPWTHNRIVDQIRRHLNGKPLISDSGIAESQRLPEEFIELTYSLCESEIARYRALGRDCSAAMEEALAEVRPGMTEYSVAGLICQKLWDHAVRPHVVLVAADERVYKFRHPIPKGNKIKKHLMAVLCGKRGGLIISLTRMLHFGRKLPEDLRRKHDAVCAVDMALNCASLPGAAMKDVFAAGVAEYERQGFGFEWMYHHQGGPTGYQGRSFLGTPEETRAVRENQAFAWNPSIQGTKSEDTILVRANGIEFLSAPTKNWPSLPVKAGGKTWKRADIKLV